MDIEGGEYSLIPFLHEFLKSQKPTQYLSLHPGRLNENINLMSKNSIHSDPCNLHTERLLNSLQFYKYMII